MKIVLFVTIFDVNFDYIQNRNIGYYRNRIERHSRDCDDFVQYASAKMAASGQVARVMIEKGLAIKHVGNLLKQIVSSYILIKWISVTNNPRD